MRDISAKEIQVELAFGVDVDYAQLIKAFRSNGFTREVYNPSDIIETVPITIVGKSGQAVNLNQLH